MSQISAGPQKLLTLTDSIRLAGRGNWEQIARAVSFLVTTFTYGCSGRTISLAAPLWNGSRRFHPAPEDGTGHNEPARTRGLLELVQPVRSVGWNCHDQSMCA